MKDFPHILIPAAAALCILLAAGCARSPEPNHIYSPTPPESISSPETTETFAPEETVPPEPVRMLLDSMSLEERVGQLFLARYPGDPAAQALEECHLGGFILFGQDFEGQTPDSIRETLSGLQAASSLPLLIAVDEEGGTVVRVSRYSTFRESPFLSPRDYFHQGGMDAVLAAEEEKAEMLKSLGIHVNLAPVADIATSPDSFMYRRSLGQDPETTGVFIAGAVQAMKKAQVGSVLKHFPGYGSNADTHTGSARDERTLEALEEADLIPFRAGIDAGCGAVMVSHNTVAAFDPSLPASLSPQVCGYLREELRFEGVIITDDLAMGAVADLFSPGEAAVLAVLAGNDLLCCTDYATQYEAVLAAVLDGRISIDRLNEAATRVLLWKQELGLIDIAKEVSLCP